MVEFDLEFISKEEKGMGIEIHTYRLNADDLSRTEINFFNLYNWNLFVHLRFERVKNDGNYIYFYFSVALYSPKKTTPQKYLLIFSKEESKKINPFSNYKECYCVKIDDKKFFVLFRELEPVINEDLVLYPTKNLPIK